MKNHFKWFADDDAYEYKYSPEYIIIEKFETISFDIE
jgi:hypothetical protein